MILHRIENVLWKIGKKNTKNYCWTLFIKDLMTLTTKKFGTKVWGLLKDLIISSINYIYSRGSKNELEYLKNKKKSKNSKIL